MLGGALLDRAVEKQMNRSHARVLGTTLVSSALFLGAALLAADARATTPDGKQIFLDQKCNMCHAVSSADITPTSKIKAPDLAGLASKEDPAFLTKFLRKAADKNGKKHIKQFTGNDEELAALIAWLQKQTESAKK
jgi:mono/diheme cytochrome c family protein